MNAHGYKVVFVDGLGRIAIEIRPSIDGLVGNRNRHWDVGCN